MTEASEETIATMTSALVDRYGPEALAAAQKQQAEAVDGMRVTWGAVVDQLALPVPTKP